MRKTQPKISIQVVERLVSLLDALAHYDTPVSLKQLAADTGLHPSTAHRILNATVDRRWVERVEPGNYRLGMRLLELGNVVKSHINFRKDALPFMQKLHEELHETVNLSVRQGDEIAYVERTSSNAAMMRVVQVIGARAPLHITAVGKIFLMEDGSEKCCEYAIRTKLPAYTENTVTELPRLLGELETIKRQGYAFDNQEAEKGVSCIGAGIYDDEGKLVAGLSVSAPSDRLNKKWAARVKEAAEQISLAIGYRPPGISKQ